MTQEKENHQAGLLYFMPYWVFEARDLTNTDKLVYSLLSGLAHHNEHRECYPSDAYIGKRLGITPGHANECLANLERFGAIKRRRTRNVKNPLKQERFIRVYLENQKMFTNTEKSEPGASEKSESPTSEISEPSNKAYISSKENLPTEGKSASRIARAPHISTSSEDHEKLVKDFGEEKVQRAYERLSEWKLDTPKSKWKKNDHLAIRRWVMDALDDQDSKRRKKGEATSDIQEFLVRMKEKNIHFFRKGAIELTKNSVTFKEGTFYLEIPFSDKEFKRKVQERVLKMNGRV